MKEGGNKQIGYLTHNWVGALPATSRHTHLLLWLLLSRPDQINKLVLRENQQSPHRLLPKKQEALCLMTTKIARKLLPSADFLHKIRN
ncbi:hypothetical protein AFL46_02985 [Providencia stuartii]|nr:hypothetical protein AFL46_02985 [Providencia stuartii]KSX96210.1 hypothetical protein APT95_14720 [Providencia stuartii]